MRDEVRLTKFDFLLSFLCRDFWSVLISLPLELQKKFLLFTTGSDRIPVGGMGEMNMKVSERAMHVF